MCFYIKTNTISKQIIINFKKSAKNQFFSQISPKIFEKLISGPARLFGTKE